MISKKEYNIFFGNSGLRDRKDWQKTDKKTKCFVIFNNLVTKAVHDRKFQLLNYARSMKYKSNLARWLHKRIFHKFVQASWNNIRSYLKKPFGPIWVLGRGSAVSNPQNTNVCLLRSDSCAVGSKPGAAYILDQNPFFEIASHNTRDCSKER